MLRPHPNEGPDVNSSTATPRQVRHGKPHLPGGRSLDRRTLLQRRLSRGRPTPPRWPAPAAPRTPRGHVHRISGRGAFPYLLLLGSSPARPSTLPASSRNLPATSSPPRRWSISTKRSPPSVEAALLLHVSAPPPPQSKTLC
ncbi:formin-like protein 5 [Iris pallida]|uniref:Formin-like protein 5 n=1 Tax=Iris pallida TaxID=29817 RepID=A0AAX6GN93_IRIPA|nr:formin-like protein 5 [Iris pallida]KAJ6840183.1 formin-like protein 5 [Iris pallida]